MPRIAPCSRFGGEAEDAAGFRASSLPGSRTDRARSVEFTLAGRRSLALNGGAPAGHTHAASFHVDRAGWAETDRLCGARSVGGAPERCGWIRDRYGVPWRIVPDAPRRMLTAPTQPGRGAPCRRSSG